MRHSYGNSICVSSQVGCRMGCRLCASTIDGLWNLESMGNARSNITNKNSLENSLPITHVVIMGKRGTVGKL